MLKTLLLGLILLITIINPALAQRTVVKENIVLTETSNARWLLNCKHPAFADNKCYADEAEGRFVILQAHPINANAGQSDSSFIVYVNCREKTLKDAGSSQFKKPEKNSVDFLLVKQACYF